MKGTNVAKAMRWVAAGTMLLGVLAVVVAQTSGPSGHNWNQYRGPERNGISPETGWKAWSGNIAKVLWRASVDTGYSAISVADGKVYTCGNKDNFDTVYCFDAKAGGKPVWTYRYACKTVPTAMWPGTRSTPLIWEGRVYTLSSEGEAFCLGAADGKPIWSKKLTEELGVKGPQWGYAGSALPLGDWVVFDMGPVVALDKRKGDIAWKSEKFMPSYASPVPMTVGGKKCLAVINGDGPAIIEIGSGKTLFKDTWKTQYDINGCDVLVSGEKFFITSGYDHGCALYDTAGGKYKQVYMNKDLADQFSTPVLKDGYVYGWHGNVGGQTLRCIELATGAVKWSGPKVDVGSVVLSGDRLIMMGNGELIVAQASPEGYKELAKARVLDGKTWTMPVLAEGRIYCRNTAGDLVCVDVSGQ
jgi:outer membrane protein assembly factor BamB